MPFTPGNPPTYTRLFAFVDEFVQGETADRADFDTFMADLESSLDAAFAFFDRDATDQRWLGPKSSEPTLRNNGDALEDGDLYVSVNVSDFGTMYFFRTGSWVAIATTPFSPYFLTLIDAVDEAELRGLMGLGSASTSDASAFATATQGTKADAALQVPNLLAVNVIDWNTVATTKTGIYQSDTGSFNSPYSGDSFTGLYIARTAVAGSLILYGVTSNRVFIRQFNTVWGEWREFNLRATGTSGNLDLMGVGVLAARFDNTAVSAPSGLGSYVGLVSHYGTDTVRWQIAHITTHGLTLTRSYDGTSWGAWTSNILAGLQTKPIPVNSFVDFDAIPAYANEIEVSFLQVQIATANNILVQAKVAGAAVTSGYAAASGTIEAATVATIESGTGHIVYSQTGAVVDGNMTLRRFPGTNTWVSSHSVRRSSGRVSNGGGRIVLAGPLDGVRITTGAGQIASGDVAVRWKT